MIFTFKFILDLHYFWANLLIEANKKNQYIRIWFKKFVYLNNDIQELPSLLEKGVRGSDNKPPHARVRQHIIEMQGEVGMAQDTLEITKTKKK